jgi:hypothetical protein
MSARGPFNAFHLPDDSDARGRARAWAKQSKRRILVGSTVASIALFGVMLGDVLAWAASALTGEAGTPPVSGLFVFAGAAILIWLDRALFLSSRPAFAIGQEPFDERQADMVARANRGGLYIAMLVIVALTVLGALVPTGFHMVGFGVAGLALVMSGPQVLLAWSLPEHDFDFSGDGEID